MRYIDLHAYAKINLFLEIGEKTPGGLHEVRSVMQTVSLADQLRLEKAEKGFSLQSDDSGLTADNIIEAAHRLVSQRTERELPVRVRLRKNIPVQAGMGGGSADAAAALMGLDLLYGLGLDRADLAKMAAELGSDVPFCLEGGCSIVEGTGELLTPIDGLPNAINILIAKPPVSISTAAMYRLFDERQNTGHAWYLAIKSALRGGRLDNIEAALFNRFEDLIEESAPSVAALKDTFLRAGADKPMMTGSGPTVFSLFSDRLKAEAAHHVVGMYYDRSWLVRPVGQSVRVADFG